MTDESSFLQIDDEFIKSVRVQMLSFALSQLAHKDQAEDAVQEALLGALKNASSFKRKAALKTWVFSILRNKIIDILRQRNRQVQSSSEAEDGQDDLLEHLFDTRGAAGLAHAPLVLVILILDLFFDGIHKFPSHVILI